MGEKRGNRASFAGNARLPLSYPPLRGGPLFPPQCGAREGSPSPRYRGWEDNHGDVPLAKHRNYAKPESTIGR